MVVSSHWCFCTLATAIYNMFKLLYFNQDVQLPSHHRVVIKKERFEGRGHETRARGWQRLAASLGELVRRTSCSQALKKILGYERLTASHFKNHTSGYHGRGGEVPLQGRVRWSTKMTWDNVGIILSTFQKDTEHLVEGSSTQIPQVF